MSNDSTSSVPTIVKPLEMTPYVNLPHWVLDSGVSGAAVKLYCVIGALSTENGRTPNITRDTLAVVMRTSTRTISTHLKELVDLGAVTVIPQYEGSSRSGTVYVLAGVGEA